MTNEPRIGRFLFDSITKGLYENPLCIFREYIQNSADALDNALQADEIKRGEARISIDVDPKASSITIEDNGTGIAHKDALAILSSIGDSPKFGQRNRGFRGIGRLGGMAYCSHLSFTTKARGEAKETVNRWDCRKMAEMLNPHNQKHRSSDLRDIVRECASFELVSSNRKAGDGFFRVELSGVSSTRNILTDVAGLRSYLAQVAPVPFDYQNFPFGREIDERLRKEVLNYNTYRVMVNDEELFKPYHTTVRLGLNKTDTITGIVPIEVLDNTGKIIGRGWRAERKELVGGILKSEGVDGIRVRVGNILIGEGELLDKVFRQERFNAYFVGEIHAVEPGLIPNSRRDDFEQNEIRKVFYEKLEEALGDPLSKLVQKRSGEHSKVKAVTKSKDIVLQVKSTLGQGFVSDSHKEKAIKDLRNSKNEIEALTGSRDPKLRSAAEGQLQNIEGLLKKIQETPDNITCSLSQKFSRAEKELLGNVFEAIYETYEKAGDQVKLCRLVVQKLNNSRK